jgi:hypothetical protein
MVEKLEVLPLPLLRKCVAPWRDPSNDHEGVKQLCSNIVETVRYLAAVHLLTVADKFQCLPGAEDRINLINNMMMSLWEGIGLLQPKIRDHVALLLGVPVPASAHDICVAVSGLGISTFFAALPLEDLRLVCDELSLSEPAPPTTDEDLLPDIFCQRLCTYFYPSLATQPEAEKCCAVRTTVHENGPGSYTCTIDNACLLSMIGQRTHISNVFTCNKVKWRARVHVHMDSHLSFSVIQRQHPRVQATMVLRSVSESKAKKAANNGTANGQGQPLRLETAEECTPKKPISFNHIVSVMEVINSTGKAPKGLYNNAEDRLSFHFTLNNEVIEASADANSQPSSPVTVEKAKAGTKPEPQFKLKPGMTKAQRAAVERGEDPTLVGKSKVKEEKPEKLAAADEPKSTPDTPVDMPLSAKKRKELDKKRKAIEHAESIDRDKITQQCASATATLHSDSNKSRQSSLQRQRDRERRLELARAQPNQELEQQVRKLQQEALQARSALARANDDRAAVDKEVAKQQQLIANRRKEIEACAERLAAAKAAIEEAELEGETLATERARTGEALERALEQEKQATQFKDIVDFAAPAPERATGTATIGDISSFWAGGGAPAPAKAEHQSSSNGASSAAQPAVSSPVSAGVSTTSGPTFNSDVFGHGPQGPFSNDRSSNSPPPQGSSAGVGSFGSFGGGSQGQQQHVPSFQSNFSNTFGNGNSGGGGGSHGSMHHPHHGHHHHHHHGHNHHGHHHHHHGSMHHSGHGHPQHGHHMGGHFGPNGGGGGNGGGMMGSPYMQGYGGSKGWSSEY